MILKQIAIATTDMDSQGNRFTLDTLKDMTELTEIPVTLEFIPNTRLGKINRLWIENGILYADLELDDVLEGSVPMGISYTDSNIISEDK